MLLVTLVPAVGAQDTPAGTTWYVHEFTSPSGAGSFLNFLPPEGETDQTATATDSAGVDNFVIAIPAEAPTEREGTATAEEGEAVVFVKSWNNLPAPRTRVRVFMLADGEEVANSGDGVIQDVMLGAIVEFRMPLTMTTDTIPTGSVVEMVVWIDDANTGMYSPFAYPRGVSEDHPWSVTLPVEFGAAEPSLVEETLPAGEDVEVELVFDNATNATYLYHWNTTLEGIVEVAYNASLTNGSVTLEVLDGSNETWLTATLEGNQSDTLEVGSVFPGNWTFNLTANDAKGSLTLTVRAAPQPEPMPVGLGGNLTAANATEGNETVDDGTILGIPGPGLLAVLAGGAAAAAWGTRRRRR